MPARYASIWLLAVVTAGVLNGANTLVNWSIVVAACAAVLAWSYAVRKVWKAEAISLGAWLSRLSRAAAPLAMSCLNVVRFGAAPGLLGVNVVARLANPATTTPAWVQKAELLLPTAGGEDGVSHRRKPTVRRRANAMWPRWWWPRPVNPRVEWVG